MQIQLQQTEIEKALRQFIQSQGISLDGRSVDMNFTAKRGNNGVTVDLNIQDRGEQINTTIGGPNHGKGSTTPDGPNKRDDKFVDDTPKNSEKLDSAPEVGEEDSVKETESDETPEENAESESETSTPLFGSR